MPKPPNQRSRPQPDPIDEEPLEDADEGADEANSTRLEKPPASREESRNLRMVKGGGKGRKPSSIHVDAALEEDDLDEPTNPIESRPRSGPKATRFQPAAEAEEPGGDEDVEAAPEADRTVIGVAPRRREESPDSTQAGPAVTVEIIEGPDRGRTAPVKGARMVIGRGDGCDFMLSDASVSRRHVELVVSASGMTMRDLGSGNGVKVNGKKVAEAGVKHGDRLALGQTVILVQDELARLEELKAKEAPPPRPAPRRPSAGAPRPPPRGLAADDDEPDITANVVVPGKRRGKGALSPRLKLGLGGGAALLVLLLLALALKPKAPPPTPKATLVQAAYDEHVENGKNLVRGGKLKEALEEFKEAQAIKDSSEVQRYLESTERDLKGNRSLAAAKVLAADGNFEQALVTLKEVDELAAAFDEAKKLGDEYKKSQYAALEKKVRDMIASGDFDGARDATAKLSPLDQDRWLKDVSDAEKRARVEEVKGKQRAAAAAIASKRARARKAQAEVDGAIASIVKKIDTGNFDGATRELDRLAESNRNANVQAKLRTLKKQLPPFRRAYDDAIQTYNGGNLEAAGRPVRAALKLYEDLDIDGTLDKRLVDMLGKCLLAKGRSAMARAEYGNAAKAYKEALQISPSPEARRALQDIASKAHEVYLEGYTSMTMSPESARKKFEDVLLMTGPEDPDHKNAQKRLKALAGD